MYFWWSRGVVFGFTFLKGGFYEIGAEMGGFGSFVVGS
jgi:hypothetical protein